MASDLSASNPLLYIVGLVLTALTSTGGVAWLSHWLTNRQKRKEHEATGKDSLWDRVEKDNGRLRLSVDELEHRNDQLEDINQELYDTLRDYRYDCIGRLGAAHRSDPAGPPPDLPPPVPPRRRPTPLS